MAPDLVSGARLLNHDFGDLQATISLNQTDVTHLLLYAASNLLFQWPRDAHGRCLLGRCSAKSEAPGWLPAPMGWRVLGESKYVYKMLRIERRATDVALADGAAVDDDVAGLHGFVLPVA
ncbi:hypothetical protein [Xanthomonas sacchari]|uniref:hypothetical protein n=1 Tax=Xanthomonas sacchari TaxID=56458 RepID=UPI002254A3CD|nr:hypothetical protein [Xanthomonas sacchari]